MKTSQMQIFDVIDNASTSSALECRASHSATLEKEEQQRILAFYGKKCIGQLERLRPLTSCSKMLLAYLLQKADWFSSAFYLIWKVKATKQNDYYCQLQLKERHTKDIGSLSLPTPTTAERVTTTEKALERQKKYGNTRRGMYLGHLAAANLLPTPTADAVDMRKKKYKQGGKPLTMAVSEILDLQEEQTGSRTFLLNPQFVAEMMGFPKDWTESPFRNGKESL